MQWVFRLHQQDRIMTKLAYFHINTQLTNELFWECNFNENDVQYVCKSKGFWNSVVYAWARYNYTDKVDHTTSQCIWYNSHLRIDNKPYEYLHEFEKVSKIVYDQLIDNETLLTRRHTSIQRTLGIIIEYKEYVEAFQYINKITGIIKYRDFQYRLLINQIYLNDRVSKWDSQVCKNCTFCNGPEGSNSHFFWLCPRVQPFWSQVKNSIQEQIPAQLDWNPHEIFLNRVAKSPKHLANLYVIVAKQLLYRWRCQKEKPNIELFQIEIEFNKKLELRTAIKNVNFSNTI